MSHLQMQASAGRQRMLCAVGCVAHCLAGALKQPTGQELYDQARGIYIKQKHWYQSKVGQPGSQAARQPGTSILHQATPTGWMGLRAPPNRKPTRLLCLGAAGRLRGVPDARALVCCGLAAPYSLSPLDMRCRLRL